jgi:hypothetical protein
MPTERFFAGRKFVKGKSGKAELLRINRREISPLREPTHSPEQTRGEKRRFAPVEMTVVLAKLDVCAGAAGGPVDGFDQGNGFTTVDAVADWLAVGLDCAQKVFENFLMAADIGHGRR